ncbi:MAG: hypothetical protein COA49_01140 [Bacteroidetes bacterium]|nr:MAG: hypothetical protein COA49_01140 [Bacteroidota bacterium]
MKLNHIKKHLDITKKLMTMSVVLGLSFVFSADYLSQTDIGIDVSNDSIVKKKKQIQILGATVIERDPNISFASRLIGNVKLGLEDAVLTCDSAYRFEDGRFEVFSNVHIIESSGIEVWADYAVLDPEVDAVEISGDVRFIHEEFSIECPALVYDLESKLVSYNQRAEIVEGNRVLSSDNGVYSSNTDRLYAGGEVDIIENDDHIISDSLAIDRNDKTLILFKRSTLKIEGAIIKCDKGNYNGRLEKGWFAGHASMEDEGGYLAGDSIVVSRNDEEGTAWGNITVRDSSGAMTIFGDYAKRTNNYDLVEGELVRLINIEEGDTLKMNSRNLVREDNMLYVFGGVVFEQGDFSGLGDSLSWDRNSNEIWLLGEPVVWSDEDEMTGDTVKMTLKENRPELMKLMGHANVLSPSNDSLDHQISGRDLDAVFKGGELSLVDVSGNGTIQYYSTDNEDIVSLNRASCAHIRIVFLDGSVSRITLLNNPEGHFENLTKESKANYPVKTRRAKPKL